MKHSFFANHKPQEIVGISQLLLQNKHKGIRNTLSCLPFRRGRESRVAGQSRDHVAERDTWRPGHAEPRSRTVHCQAGTAHGDNAARRKAGLPAVGYAIFITIVTLVLFTFTGYAQQGPPQGGGGPGLSIVGQVIDSLSDEPLEYASVSLKTAGDDKTVNGALTEADGKFRIGEVAPGSYNLEVSFMGYATKRVGELKVEPGTPVLDAGKIYLALNSEMMEQVTVEGEVPLIQNKVDKIVYNAERDVTSAGGNASDVLRKVPMVTVDHNDNVALRGNQNVRVLINGKPSGATQSNLADVLRSIPADQIANVEVITSPSAKYDAEGSGGIINIITKEKKAFGVSGSVSGGLGTRRNNGNVNLNIRRDKLGFTANVGGNLAWPQTSYTNNWSQNTTQDVFSTSSGSTRSQWQFYNASGTLTYDADDANLFSSSFRFRKGQFTYEGLINNQYSQNGSTIDYNMDTDNERGFGGFDWDADYTHKFKKEGEELVLAGQWSQNTSKTDYTTLYTGFAEDQIADNDGTNNEYTVQLDYTLPLGEKFKLEAGGKSIFRRMGSEVAYFMPDGNGGFELNPLTSYDYDYNQDVLAGYTVLTANLENGIGIQIGGRVENTQIDGKSDNPELGLQEFKHDYTNFVPSLTLSKKLSDVSMLKLGYTKRIQRPGLRYLNPFRDTSDPLRQSQGNPELEPEIAQTVELGYSTTIKSSSINAAVYYRHTNDIIESFVSNITDEDGNTVFLTNYGNIGENNSIGLNFFGSVNLFENLTLRANFDAFTYRPTVSSGFQTAQDNKTYVQYNGSVNGTLRLDGGFSVETFAMLNSPRRTFQGTNASFSMWMIGMKKEILNKRGSIGLNIIEPLNERKDFSSDINSGNLVQNTNFSIPFRSFGVSFSWNFGKMDFRPDQRRKRGVDNDDMKEGGNQGGMPMN